MITALQKYANSAIQFTTHNATMTWKKTVDAIDQHQKIAVGASVALAASAVLYSTDCFATPQYLASRVVKMLPFSHPKGSTGVIDSIASGSIYAWVVLLPIVTVGIAIKECVSLETTKGWL